MKSKIGFEKGIATPISLSNRSKIASSLQLTCESDNEYEWEMKAELGSNISHNRSSTPVKMSSPSSSSSTRRKSTRASIKRITSSTTAISPNQISEFVTNNSSIRSADSNVDLLNAAFLSCTAAPVVDQSNLSGTSFSTTMNKVLESSKRGQQLAYGQEYEVVASDEPSLTVCRQADQQAIFNEMYTYKPITTAEQIDKDDELDSFNDVEQQGPPKRQHRFVRLNQIFLFCFVFLDL